MAFRYHLFAGRIEITSLSEKEDIVLLKKLINIKNCIFLLVIALFALELLTMHAFLDDNVKLFSIIALLFVLFIPFLLIKHKGILSFFRFMVLFLAFIPTIHPPTLNSLLQNSQLFSVMFSADHNLIVLSVVSRELLFVLLILAVIALKHGYSLKKWHFVLCACSAICAAGMFLFTALWDILLYFSTYFLIILTYDFMEKVIASCKEKYEKIVIYLIITTLFCKGLYQMLVILETHPFI